jgi:hypothetical protein
MLAEMSRIAQQPRLSRWKHSSLLTGKDKPVKVHRFAPHIILRSNLPLFVNRLANVAGISAS